MAADSGFFPEWYASGWFPAVWFAPGDESHLAPEKKRRGGMSYDQVLAANAAYQSRETALAAARKKKRRGRRAREREQMLLLMPAWPL